MACGPLGCDRSTALASRSNFSFLPIFLRLSGSVRVRTRRGTLESFVAVPKGEPETFPTADEVRAKFESLARPCLSARRIDALAQALMSLDEASDVGALLSLTRGAGAPPLKMAAGDD